MKSSRNNAINETSIQRIIINESSRKNDFNESLRNNIILENSKNTEINKVQGTKY